METNYFIRILLTAGTESYLVHGPYLSEKSYADKR